VKYLTVVWHAIESFFLCAYWSFVHFSLEKCLFSSLIHFAIGLSFYYKSFIKFASNLSNSLGYLFTFLIVTFQVQMFLILMMFSSSILNFVACTVIPKKALSKPSW
jgi:hypothetical protein